MNMFCHMMGKVLPKVSGDSHLGVKFYGALKGHQNIEEQEKRLLDELCLVEKMNQYVNYENRLDQLPPHYRNDSNNLTAHQGFKE